MLLCFVAYSASSGLSYQTVWLYLSAVRHLQILCIGQDPLLEAYPLQNFAIKGLHRSPVGKKPRCRLPITPAFLQEIFQFWSRTPHQFEYVLLWAVFCLGFFCLMCSGEFTCPSMSAFTSDLLTAQDISVHSQAHPSYIVVRLKRSKNDPFAVGTRVYIVATNQSMCLVSALLGYLAICPKRSGPLFIFQDGSTQSCERLVSSLRQVLSDAGVSTAQYSGHSFRIGAATTAAKLGVPDSLIKKMGRWKSSMFIHYICTPRQQLAGISSWLVQRDN